MNIGVVIVCAGSGKRLGKIDKTILKLSRKPLFYHSFSAFAGIGRIKQIVLVMQKKHFALAKKVICSTDAATQRVSFIKGGLRRQDSVKNGLESLDNDIDYVLIHDGARPFVSKKLILCLIRELKNHPAVICAVGPKDTLKTVSQKGYIKKTLNRNIVACVQTPQGFKKDLIVRAYFRQSKKYLFDDAQAVESLGEKVKVIEGESSNIKITYPFDIEIAKATLGSRVKG